MLQQADVCVCDNVGGGGKMIRGSEDNSRNFPPRVW